MPLTLERGRSRGLRRLTGLIVALIASHATAADATDRVAPIRAELGFEQLTLPGDETMGLAGASLLFRLDDGWWAGPAVYGAASGQRGGLFVGGAEVRRQWSLPAGWELGTGLYAGGGGGAAAPVGGGLMLRAAATLSHDFGPLRAGLSWAHVRFPSGDIRSSQLGVVLTWERPFRSFDASAAGAQPPASGATGLGFQRITGTAGLYALRGSDTRRVGTIGGRADWAASPAGWFTGIEAAAAASGGAAGYMEILGAGGWRDAVALWPRLTLEARAALGLGGGGAMPTGGGAIAKASVGAGFDWGGGWRSGIELGTVAALDAPLRARTTHLWLAMDLQPSPAGPANTVSRNEWSASVQRQVRAQRNDGTSAPLDAIGMKLNRFIGDHAYLSAQAHSAFAGGAGAYSIGLIGAGLATGPGQGTRWGSELLVGAAGGGGVATGGGAIVQALAWLALPAAPDWEVRFGLGAVRSLRGGNLSSAIVELSVVRALGL